MTHHPENLMFIHVDIPSKIRNIPIRKPWTIICWLLSVYEALGMDEHTGCNFDQMPRFAKS